MLRTLFTFVVISLISFSGYSNPISSTKNDSVVVQRNNVGVAEGAAEDVFEFVDLKENYCGNGSHRVALKLKKNMNPAFYDVKLVLNNEVWSKTNEYFGSDKIYYYTFHIGLIHVFYLQNMQLTIEDSEGKYKSVSKKFNVVSAELNANYKEHCEGFSSKIELVNYAPFDSITWKLNNSLIPNHQGLNFNASEAGTYSATIDYKGCSYTTNSIIITKNSIPETEIFSLTGDSFCKGSKALLKFSHKGYQEFPYTEYEWMLNDKKVSDSKESTLSVSESGDYYLVTKQGKCVSKSKTVKLSETLSPANAIFFSPAQYADDLKITVCKDLPITLSTRSESSKNRLFRNGGHFYEYYVSDTLLREIGYEMQWKKDGQDLPGAIDSYFTTRESGKYQLIKKQGNCISASNQLEVTYAEEVALKLFPSETITCKGEYVYLDFEPYYLSNDTEKFSLFKNGSLVEEKTYGGTKGTFQVYETGKYQVKIKQKNNCTYKSDIIPVTFITEETVLPPDTIYSCNDTLIISDKYAFYDTSRTYFSWSLDGKIISEKQYDNYIKITRPGLYVMTAENSLGCKIKKNYRAIFNNIKLSMDMFDLNPLCDDRSSQIRILLPDKSKISYQSTIQLLKDDVFYAEKDVVLKFDLQSNSALTSFDVFQPGEYKVRVKDPNCKTETKSINVNFVRLDNRTNPEARDFAACKNSIELIDNPGNKYQWFLNNIAIPGSDYQIKVSKGGTYYARIERDNCIKYTAKSIVVPPSESLEGTISGDTLVNSASTVNLNLSFSGTPPFSYKLNNNDEGLASLNKHLHPVKVNSSSTFNLVSVKNACGEGTVSGSAIIKVNVLANEPSVGRHIRIFPVPTTGSVEIEFDQLNRHELSFQVINMSGQVIISETKLSEPKKKLDLSHLSPGEYLIRMNVGKEVVTRKIIRQ